MRGGRAGRRVLLGAHRLDVGLEAVERRLQGGLRVVGGRERRRRAVAFLRREGGLALLRRQFLGRRPAPGRQRLDLAADVGRAARERGLLRLVPLDALVEAPDLDLVRVRRLALLAAVALAPRDLDAHALDVGLALGHARGGGGFLRLHLDDARLGGGDGLRQHALAAGEQHLLPAAQLVAQALVAPGLRRLPFQRAALLLDLEDDVVDAREVLLRRVELQLGGAPAGAVLRHAGGLLDQLAPIGGPRAQDHADLALLDDRVGLGPEPRVHQQLVDVAQPAHLAVDEVFALAGPVEAPRHLHLAHHRAPLVVDQFRARPGLDRHRHAREHQAHLGGRVGLAGVAAAEDDVLHAVAAEALGALLAEDPHDGVGHVALAAPVGPDNRGDAAVERQLGPIAE